MAVNFSYFTIIRDLGRDGLEGISHPELTRRNIIDRLRNSEWPDLYAIHFAEVGEPVEDVTKDLLREAGRLEDYTGELTLADRLAWLHDRRRDELKHA